jgi:glycosyltransferase involved in cell wall biosynthesis
MHLLMIAPEPFFEPRGTPFSEFHRIRALLELGHTVDLVTYPFGRNVDLPGLRIVRCMRPPLVRRVKIGPSLAKVPLDVTLAMAATRLALTRRYDAIHSHEEGGAIGIALAMMLGIPHLYDMHSSLPQQLANFSFSESRVLRWMFARLERSLVTRSRVVIVICPQLAETVRAIDPSIEPIVIENAPGSGEAPEEGAGGRVRASLGLASDIPIVLYTGTFEAYQGLDLLLDAARLVVAARRDARIVLAGGHADQIAAFRRRAAEIGIADHVIFAGERPAEEIPEFLAAADVLVSPRSTGTNTPLKIYQYLRAGKPIVATRLLTHTQVLDDQVSILTDPTPEAFAGGILRALADRSAAAALGERARHLAATKYSYDAYLERTRRACDALRPPARPAVADPVA